MDALARLPTKYPTLYVVMLSPPVRSVRSSRETHHRSLTRLRQPVQYAWLRSDQARAIVNSESWLYGTIAPMNTPACVCLAVIVGVVNLGCSAGQQDVPAHGSAAIQLKRPPSTLPEPTIR